jgi:hypothetical protein
VCDVETRSHSRTPARQCNITPVRRRDVQDDNQLHSRRLYRSLLGISSSEALKSCLASVNRTAATPPWQDFMTKTSDAPSVPDQFYSDRLTIFRSTRGMPKTAVRSF